MSSTDWSYTVHQDFQHAGAAAVGNEPATPLGRWSAGQSARRPAELFQRARYAGQAAAVLLGVVGVCSAIAQFVFG